MVRDRKPYLHGTTKRSAERSSVGAPRRGCEHAAHVTLGRWHAQQSGGGEGLACAPSTIIRTGMAGIVGTKGLRPPHDARHREEEEEEEEEEVDPALAEARARCV